MAHVIIDAQNLRIELSSWDAFLALHGSLTIPLEHVVAVRVEDKNGWHAAFRKIAGTSLPGIKTAGTFFDGGLAFLDYESGRQCLVLETQHETYRRIIVQPDEDPDALAAEIQSRIPRNPDAVTRRDNNQPRSAARSKSGRKSAAA